MATTLRVEDDVKVEFDKLQGLIQAETSERVSQSELLARLLRVGRRHEAEVLESGERAWHPPSWGEIQALLASQPRDVPETDSSRIDDVLYGEEPDP